MKNKRIFIILLVACFILIGTNSFASPIKLIVGNEHLNLKVDPVNISGTTLVPVRPIFESLGASVEWDGNTKKVKGILNDKIIELIIDEKIAKVNNETVKLDIPAKIINGNTMVPTRFVAESLDADVKWDQVNRSILINSDPLLVKYYDKNDIFTHKDLINKVGEFKHENLLKRYGKFNRKEFILDDYYGEVNKFYYDFGYVEFYESYERVNGKFVKMPVGGMPSLISIEKRIDFGDDFIRGIKVGDNYNDVLNKFPSRGPGKTLFKEYHKGSYFDENNYARKVFDNKNPTSNDYSLVYTGYKDGNNLIFVVGVPETDHTFYRLFLEFKNGKVSRIFIEP